MKLNVLILAAFLVAIGLVSGCASLLPSGREETRSPWKSFDEAKAAYDRVVPNSTNVIQLRDIGFNIYSTPNVRILNYVDIAQATQTIERGELDEGFRKCLQAKNGCRGYMLEPKNIRSKRYGNLLLDILNFRRKSKESGWRFRVLFVVVDDIVVEKLWSGEPVIESVRDMRNPLGPLQEAGSLLPKLW
ncbi:MAG TPA: hypothetical protein VFY07_03020 [Geomobilimonas sp.]|nr:hypothetical protein [Geomobilimonas sp.]